MAKSKKARSKESVSLRKQLDCLGHQLEVEAALEKVRRRAMAMRASTELVDVADVLREQMAKLGQPELETAAIHLYEEDPGFIHSWRAFRLGTKTAGKISKGFFAIPKDSCAVAREFISNFKSGKKEYTIEISGKKQDEWYNNVLFKIAPDLKKALWKQRHEPRYYHLTPFSGGALLMVAVSKPSVETMDLQRRAANAFDLAYRRFLDLKLAEAQAREAQIQLAMERVRARTMAMQTSAELPEAANLLFQQVQSLGMPAWSAGYCIWDNNKEAITLWMSSKGVLQPPFKLPLNEDPSCIHFLEAHLRGETFYVEEIGGEALVKHYTYMRSLPVVGEVLQSIIDAGFPLPTFQIFHCVYFSKGFLLFITYEPVPEAHDIFKRFGKVFDQTYTRFLDLQKAEAQAREAEIQLALERVRARAMAMHRSDELKEVASVMREQFSLLGQPQLETVAIHIYPDEGDTFTSWAAIRPPDNPGKVETFTTEFSKSATQLAREMLSLYKSKSGEYTINAKGDAMAEWLDMLFKAVPTLKQVWGDNVPDEQFWHFSDFSAGTFVLIPREEPSRESKDLLKRSASVFDLAYRRYADLKKAEAQAREATIQASLERVRAKAMAMHNSKDLAETIHAFYRELVSMNLTPRRCGIGLMDKQSHIAEINTMNTTEDGISVETIGNLNMRSHPVLVGIYEHWIEQKEYRPVLRGQEIKAYYQVLRKQVTMPDYPPDAVLFGYFFSFEEGGVFAWIEKELHEEELNIYRRFTSVLSLTYKRYKDLKDAEARAKEAVKQASLDRVRAEIASMRSADDLQRITPLIWRELRTLGVPFFRCGVLIVNEKNQQADYYLSTPEGHPLAALHLDFTTEIQVVQAALEHWRQQKVFKEHWNKEQFVAFARSMMEIGQIQTMKSYQGGDQPPESITLQFIPFAQGMLYVGSAEELTAEQIGLVQALADAFSTAYARYEDFTRLEAAKATVEKTLSELRTTQTQLVQSEKMASLGELTAGIAHEIQNPLNFVNNFSEVSKELLDEMEDELKKGNTEDALQIAKDIIQNLEKINLHGKRADGIVKSMLQHSRKSTGQKELTDINALCDEYLRLAYHGLRAKEKSFNAKFESRQDPTLPKVNVVPQELGRVVLNLINNAFYAVSEKAKQGIAGYEPTVSVRTKRVGTPLGLPAGALAKARVGGAGGEVSTIEITVTDNGPGIPDHIKDKIFQPFFTTKPTGQGTGLGLSLSYDIVKAHGGELSVQTKVGEGSEFRLMLPAL